MLCNGTGSCESSPLCNGVCFVYCSAIDFVRPSAMLLDNAPLDGVLQTLSCRLCTTMLQGAKDQPMATGNTEYGLDAPLDTAHALTLIAAITPLLYAACKD